LDDHARVAKALGARGAHVVEPQHLEHRRARHAGDDRHRPEAQRDGRQHQVREGAAPGHGEPSQLHGEDQSIASRPNQNTGMDTPISEPIVTGEVEQVFWPQRRDDAGRDADQQRDEHGAQRELDRVGEELLQVVDDQPLRPRGACPGRLARGW
jgi:hypothetical protein